MAIINQGLLYTGHDTDTKKFSWKGYTFFSINWKNGVRRLCISNFLLERYLLPYEIAQFIFMIFMKGFVSLYGENNEICDNFCVLIYQQILVLTCLEEFLNLFHLLNARSFKVNLDIWVNTLRVNNTHFFI